MLLFCHNLWSVFSVPLSVYPQFTLFLPFGTLFGVLSIPIFFSAYSNRLGICIKITLPVSLIVSLFALTLYAQMRFSTKNTIFIRRTDSNKTEANTYTYISIYSTARSNHSKTASHHICGLTLSVNHVFCMRAYFTLDVVAFQHYFACTTTTINTYGEHYLECLPTFILLLRFALFHINRSRILLIIILVHIVPPKERKRYGHFIPSFLCKLNILHVQLVVLSSGNYLKI